MSGGRAQSRCERRLKVFVGPGTLPAHTGQFVLWLVAVIVILGGLGFLPVLARGPIAEHVLLQAGTVFK